MNDSLVFVLKTSRGTDSQSICNMTALDASGNDITSSCTFSIEVDSDYPSASISGNTLSSHGDIVYQKITFRTITCYDSSSGFFGRKLLVFVTSDSITTEFVPEVVFHSPPAP